MILRESCFFFHLILLVNQYILILDHFAVYVGVLDLIWLAPRTRGYEAITMD